MFIPSFGELVPIKSGGLSGQHINNDQQGWVRISGE
jgi:hypothetical protein